MMRPSTCVVIALLCAAAAAVAATSAPSTEAAMAPTQPSAERPPAAQPTPELVQALKGIVNDFLGSPRSPLTRRLIAAKVSSGCTVGLMKLLRAFRNMEPWAYRLLDASGKYPTGLFQGTLSDVGAFDECIETVVRDYYGRETARAQYCNVYLDGNATEVLRYLTPAIVMSHPRVFLWNFLSWRAFVPLSRLCFGIYIVHVPLFFIKSNIARERIFYSHFTFGTITLLARSVYSTEETFPAGNGSLTTSSDYAQRRVLATWAPNTSPDTTAQGTPKPKFLDAARTFIKTKMASAGDGIARKLLQADISIGCTLGILEFMKSLQNLEPWAIRLIDATAKYPNGLFQGTVADIGAYDECIETVVKNGDGTERVRAQYCNLHVQPNKGGQTFLKELDEVFSFTHKRLCLGSSFTHNHRKHCCRRFFKKEQREIQTCGFFIYLKLSEETGNRALVAVIAVIRRFIRVTLPTFFMIMCMYLLPLIASGPNSKEFYTRFYAEMRDHWWDLLLLIRNWREDPIVVAQTVGWCLALSCGLYCLFMKHQWYCRDTRASEANRMLYAFTDQNTLVRVLGVVRVRLRHKKSSLDLCLFSSWSGSVSQFLSWEGFLPLSRLSFGVYLLHSPFFTLSAHIARERLFFSHYTLVSQCFAVLIWCYVLAYVMFILCEGPTTNLEALLFARHKRKQAEQKSTDIAGGQTENGSKPQQVLYKDAMVHPVPPTSARLEKWCRL
ncbi:hypothetical protein MTO96_013826 [Rhipicephalus appendiculatus]